MVDWIITIKKVESFCGICEITWKSSLQPQTLCKLVPRNPSKNMFHPTLLEAADKFYAKKGGLVWPK